MTTVYITKYALTQGIIKVDDVTTNTPDGSVRIPDWGCTTRFHKEQWHLTKADAIKKAESMRDNKITSFEKQLVKLKAMKFE